jgi:hypothetical protein
MREINGPLTEIEFIAFDLETTGLSATTSQIVEMGGIRFRADGSLIQEFEQLIDPQCAIPRRATRVHGITDMMVQGMPTLRETLPRFLDFLGQDQAILLAHNALFDVGFLQAAIRTTGCCPLGNPVIDTLQLARRCVRDTCSYRLEDLVIHLRLADFGRPPGLIRRPSGAGLVLPHPSHATRPDDRPAVVFPRPASAVAVCSAPNLAPTSDARTPDAGHCAGAHGGDGLRGRHEGTYRSPSDTPLAGLLSRRALPDRILSHRSHAKDVSPRSHSSVPIGVTGANSAGSRVSICGSRARSISLLSCFTKCPARCPTCPHSHRNAQSGNY